MSKDPVVITLTLDQRKLIRQSTGKNIAELGVEPVETGSGWLCPAGRKKFWLLKHADPESYRAARRNQKPHIDPERANFRLRIGKSRIHHLGVFAEERIQAQGNVIEYVGEVVNPVEFYRRTKHTKATYAYRLSQFWTLDGSIGGSGAEFINHSCDPNLRWHRLGDRILCQSIRPISAGEELTLDYHFRNEGPKVRCLCGSPKCRGTINVARKGRSKARTMFGARKNHR